MSSGNGLAAVVTAATFMLLVHTTDVRCQSTGVGSGPSLGDERIVFQTTFGEVELALYHESSVVLSQMQDEESKSVPLEVQRHVKHDKRGILSMGRLDDPNSGGSSFSILLGPAPHLDMNYGIFGEVTKGFDTLTAFEGVETIKEGIFVMPKERISILSSYVYSSSGAETTAKCEDQLAALQERFDAQAHHMHQMRSAKLP